MSPTTTLAAVCACGCEHSGVVSTYDHAALALSGSQKTTLAKWEGDKTDPCKFKLNVVSSEGTSRWVSLNIGVHPKNPKKFQQALTFGRKTPFGFESRGYKSAKGNVPLPFTYTSGDGATVVTVTGDESSGYELRSSTCDYELDWAPVGNEPWLEFRVPEGSYSAMGGLCHDCDGDYDNDMTMCESGTPSSDLKTIADSCVNIK